MRRLLAVLLGASVILNLVLLLRPSPPPPAPAVKIVPVMEKVFVPTSEPSAPPPAPPVTDDKPLVRPVPPVPVPQGTFTLTALPATVYAGDSIQVRWSGPASGRSLNDWIGLFAAGADAQSYVGWKSAGTATQGEMAFPAPAMGGTYELRFIQDNGSTAVAVSNPVTVIGTAAAYALVAYPSHVAPGGTITVSWTHVSGKRTPRDWIGLYAVRAGNQAYVDWKYVPEGSQGTLTFAAPGEPGSYEFRVLLDNAYGSVGSTPPLTILP